MASSTPVWSESNVVGNTTDPKATTLARGSTARGTLDLLTKLGAYLFVRIGRGGTTGLTNGCDVLIRRVLEGASNVAHPGALVPLLSSTTAASSTTCATSNSNAAQPALNVALITGFAAGDFILIGGGTAREEWARVSKTATGILTLDRDLTFTHTTAQADTVRNKADVFAPVWIIGGAVYEVVFDYGDDTAGESLTVECKAQVYASDLIA
jgi:hypothetical protein